MNRSKSLAQEMTEAVCRANDDPETAAFFNSAFDYLLEPATVAHLSLAEKCQVLIAACKVRRRQAIIRERWAVVKRLIEAEEDPSQMN